MKKITEKIVKDLIIEIKKEGKDISWFKFAKKTKTGGWRFLANKEMQWIKLEVIAKNIAKKYRKYTVGEIVDIISEIVNK